MPVAFSNGSGGWTIRNGGRRQLRQLGHTKRRACVLVGDYNGDNRDDIALLRQDSGWGTVPVAFSNGSGGWTIRNGGVGNFASWATRSGVRVLVSATTTATAATTSRCCAKTRAGGTVPVAFSNGSGGWTIRNGGVGNFASWATRSGVRVLVGDYNGDNRDDIALLRQDSGWGTVAGGVLERLGRLDHPQWRRRQLRRLGNGQWRAPARRRFRRQRPRRRCADPPDLGLGHGAGGIFERLGRLDHPERRRRQLRQLGHTKRRAVCWSATTTTTTVTTSRCCARTRAGRRCRWPSPRARGSWQITNNTIGSFASWATRSGVRPLVGDFADDGRDDVALIRQHSGWGTMPLAIATGQPPITTRRLTVARHNTATGNNALVDQILRDASAVLQTNDGPGDVACPVAFARQGNMTVFNNTDGTLNTSGELGNRSRLPRARASMCGLRSIPTTQAPGG